MIRNNKGFGSREILTMSVVCLILAACLLAFSVRNSNQEKYKVLEYNARLFAINATTYQMENNNNAVYMIELLDNELFARVKNPFGGEDYCDILESKVEYQDDKKYVTLRCGEYLIDHQHIAAEKYEIYKVGAWMEEKPEGEVEEITAYNYKMNNKDGFDIVYNDTMFLYAFNKLMGQNYQNISDIPSDYQVYSKTLYRTKVLVDVIESSNKGEE